MARRPKLTNRAELPWELSIPSHLWKHLEQHLFQGDGDEHGAVLLAGIATTSRSNRLLVREVIIAQDGRDYVPGTFGYRALSAEFVARAARRAKTQSLSYLAVHCHGGFGRVGFSAVDIASHERGYPALLQLVGRPIGGLVFAKGAVAGDIWAPDGERHELAKATIVGKNLTVLRSGPVGIARGKEIFERQARLLGPTGLEQLQGLRVGLVGLGGAGSMAAEMLVRLGVRDLVYVDPERIEESNLSRVVGSATSDVVDERRTTTAVKRRLRDSRFKVDIASRAAKRSGLPVKVKAFRRGVSDADVVVELTTCDWIVLAADSQIARHVVNAIAHSYLIPFVQVGVKVPVEEASGSVGDIFCVARHVTPSAGCLWCNGLVEPTELQLEAMGDLGERAREYVGRDAPAPSVITLNGISVAMAISDLLLSSVSLLDLDEESFQQRVEPRTHRYHDDLCRRDPDCFHCGGGPASLLALGDQAVLPCIPKVKRLATRSAS